MADDELAAVHAGVFGDAFALGKGEQLGHRQAVEVVEPGAGRRRGSAARRGSSRRRDRWNGNGWRGASTAGANLHRFAHQASAGQVASDVAGTVVATSDGHGVSSKKIKNFQ